MDFYILDKNDPVVRLTAKDDESPVTKVDPVEGKVWWHDVAVEMFDQAADDEQMTPIQFARFFGREATTISVKEFDNGGGEPTVRTARRVSKREPEEGKPKRDYIGELEAEMYLRADGEIVKTDPDKQIVFGWAYVAIDKSGEVNVDKSGDFVDEIEEIEKSAYDYVLRSRASDANHTNVKGGEMVESIVFTPEKIEKMGLEAGSVPLGWWVGYKINDKDTWEKVKKGELRAFSIHGAGTRTKVAPE